jgi:hypothetical protein
VSGPKGKSAEYEAAEALFGLRRGSASEGAKAESEGAKVGDEGPKPAAKRAADAVLAEWSGRASSGSEGAVGDRPLRAAVVEVLVLRDEVSAAAVLALADAEGWQLREESSRAHLVLASRRWITTTNEEVTYVIDHPGGAQSLRVEGTWAAALAKRLRDWLPCHAEAELLDVVLGPDGTDRAVEPDPVECVRVASKLAAIRPEHPSPRHVAALARLLGHPSDAVRRAGIRSAYGCRWPVLRAVVERRRAEEQRLAAQLEALRRYLDGEGEGR